MRKRMIQQNVNPNRNAEQKIKGKDKEQLKWQKLVIREEYVGTK
ncbi:hypothetical protein SAMN05192534_103127 [Alteribacillus persepolensis]|uniref:Uncharacterized protein n=1 Tax=Alteribacillus persepolensis TaxID=568899 RepID=A0A1G8B2K4_9BACI|nr:hypothetical protein [Alteribacillus persepolensis]SDH27492.1 hypothetical protein SAMN05192534_103127 [Alteribacillus persepolensis]